MESDPEFRAAYNMLAERHTKVGLDHARLVAAMHARRDAFKIMYAFYGNVANTRAR